MKKIALILFLFLYVNIFAFDAEQFTSKIATNIGVNLYNIEPGEANKYIELILEKNKKNIRAFQLIDSIDDSVLYQVYQNDGLYVKEKDIPSFVFKQYKKTIKKIIYEGEDVGRLIVYYDDFRINLTKEEIQWIKGNPTIHVGGELDWAPFDFVNENDVYDCLANDYLKAIAEISDLNFQIHTGKPWKELLQGFENKEFDILPAMYHTKDREEYTLYSTPYLRLPDYIFTKDSYKDLKSIDELNGKKVVAIEGYEIADWLQKNKEKIQIVYASSILNALKILISGQADAFIGDNPSTSYVIKENFLQSIKMNTIIVERSPLPVHIGIRKDYPLLHSIINKSLKKMKIAKKRKITSKWFMKAESKNKVNLTQEEEEWIKTHTVKMGVEEWIPATFLNKEKEIDGISGDFIKKIIKRTGLKVIYMGGEWNDLIKDFEIQKIDLLADAYNTKHRLKFGNLSDGYFKVKDGIYLKESNSNIHSLKDLNGKTLAIINGYATVEKIQEKFPDIKLVLTDSLSDSIDRVLNGEVTALYDGQLVVETKIQSEFIKGLKLGSVKDFEAPSLHFYSNLNEPLLASIIQKGLKSISYQE